MKDKTNTTEKTAQQQPQASHQIGIADLKMNEDLKHSILIVSIIANLFVFTAWIALQVTTQFDSQVMSFLFNR